jgi:hypothetical protein
MLPFGMVTASTALEACVTGGLLQNAATAVSAALTPSVPLALGTLLVSLCVLETKNIMKLLANPVARLLLSLCAVGALVHLLQLLSPLLAATLAHKAVAPLLKPSVGLALGVAAATIAVLERDALAAAAAQAAPGVADVIASALLAMVAFRTAMGPGASALAHYREMAAAKQAAAAVNVVVAAPEVALPADPAALVEVKTAAEVTVAL